MPYQLSDEIKDKIFKGFLHADAPGDLRQEVALLRTLAQKAVDADQPALAEKLISALARVSAAQIAAELKAGNYIEKSTLVALLLSTCDLLSQSLRDCGVGDDLHNEIMECTINGLGPMIQKFDQPRLLETDNATSPL